MRNLHWADLGKTFRVESGGTREILLLANVSGKVWGDLRAQAKGTRDTNRVFQLPLASRAQATELYICKAQQFRDTSLYSRVWRKIPSAACMWERENTPSRLLATGQRTTFAVKPASLSFQHPIRSLVA